MQIAEYARCEHDSGSDGQGVYIIKFKLWHVTWKFRVSTFFTFFLKTESFIVGTLVKITHSG